MRAIFASDFDSTLHFPHRGGVSESDLAAIERFRERGGLFGINTGRSARSLRNSTEGVIDPDFTLCMSGAHMEGPSGELVYEQLLPRELAIDVLARYRWPALGLCIAVCDESWAVPPLAWFPLLPRRIATRAVPRLSRLPEKIYGLSIRFFRVSDAERARASMQRRYGSKLSVFRNLTSLDVVAGGCSKGSGLMRAKQELGADIAAAMGDSLNDLPQLEAADVAYTFPNAPEELRAAADALMPSVAAALDDLLRRYG